MTEFEQGIMSELNDQMREARVKRELENTLAALGEEEWVRQFKKCAKAAKLTLPEALQQAMSLWMAGAGRKAE